MSMTMTMATMSVARDWAAAFDPAIYSRAAGIVPDPWQERVLRSEAQRILLLASRQSGKSQTVATLAAHEAVYKRDSLILLLSPSLRQSTELFRKVRDVLTHTGTATDPLSETKLAIELPNGSRVISLPGTSEATIRGYSKVTLLLVDEASRVADALYAAVRPMLAVSRGRLIALSTPWGRRGWFYRSWVGPENWRHVEVPAEQCPRLDPAFLEEERRVLGPLLFESEYLCKFVDPQGALFPMDQIERAITGDYDVWHLGNLEVGAPSSHPTAATTPTDASTTSPASSPTKSALLPFTWG